MTQSFIKIMSGENLADTNPNKEFTLVNIPDGMAEVKFNQLPQPHVLVNGTKWDVDGNVYVMNQSGKTVATFTPIILEKTEAAPEKIRHKETFDEIVTQWKFVAIENFVLLRTNLGWRITDSAKLALYDPNTGDCLDHGSLGPAKVIKPGLHSMGTLNVLAEAIKNRLPKTANIEDSDFTFNWLGNVAVDNIKDITLLDESSIGIVNGKLESQFGTFDLTKHILDNHPLKGYVENETMIVTTNDGKQWLYFTDLNSSSKHQYIYQI